MTVEEVMALKVGDRVEQLCGGRWVVGVVECDPWRLGSRAATHVRRAGRTRAGHRFAVFHRENGDLKPLPPHDPLSAHVYADFLEEHGELKAAGMLREAFPLADGKTDKKEDEPS